MAVDPSWAGPGGPAAISARRRVSATLCVATVLFALSLPVFLEEALGTAISDIPSQFSVDQPSSVYSLLILLVLGVTWMGADQVAMGWTASVFLGACVALKGVLALQILLRNSERALAAASLAVALTFVMPIPNWWNPGSIYLGQFAPTIWHNPTTIVAVPAAILLFTASLHSLWRPTTGNVACTSALCVLSAAIKPAYVVVLLPVFLPWFCWRSTKLHATSPWQLMIYLSILVAPVTVVLIIQAILVVVYRDTWITVSPFAVWLLYTPNPLASLLLSVAFPLAVTIGYWDRVRKDTGVVLAWLTFAVAVAALVLFAEEGARFAHGNFFWGTAITNYLLFVTTADGFIRQPRSARFFAIMAVFLLHLASGIYFYWRIAMGLGYY